MGATERPARAVVLRAASGARVGMGHAMRSLAVAEEVAARGVHARVVVDDPETCGHLARRCATRSSLHVECAEEAAGPPWGGDVVWLDGFRDWERELDAAAAADVPVLLVENRTADRERAAFVLYPALHHEHDAWDRSHPERVLSGPPWIPLRRSVTEATAPAGRDVDLLVTFGGSDPFRSTERVLRALPSDVGRVVVAVGALMAGRTGGLASLGGTDVELLSPGDDLAPWLPRARRALTAVGTTLVELAHHGVPAAILANYPSDAPALERYAADGPHVPLGIAEALDDETLARRLAAFLEQERPAHALGHLRDAGLGGGALRLAELLIQAATRSRPRTSPGAHGPPRRPVRPRPPS